MILSNRTHPIARYDPRHPEYALKAPQRRSVLIPGCEHFAGTEKFLLKAFELQDTEVYLFDVTADLEDGAAIGNEAKHAERVAEILRDRGATLALRPQHSEELTRETAEVGRVATQGARDNTPSFGGRKPRFGLRIHDIGSPHWANDLEIGISIAGPWISYITLPKVHSANEVERVARALSDISRSSGLCNPPPMHVLIETRSALDDAQLIAAHPLVEVLDFGLLDFISEHAGLIPAEAMRSPLQFEHALIHQAKVTICSAAARFGKVASHNITTEINDTAIVAHDAQVARNRYGFTRMWSIHPNQIEPITVAMQPDFGKLALAQTALLQGYESHWAPIRLNGELHDRASYRHFWNLVVQARMHGVELLPEIETLFFCE